MRGLLLHWCMLGQVDEIGADRLGIRLHVDGLREETDEIRGSDSLLKWFSYAHHKVE